MLPLHLLAGFQAQISPSLIVAYYGGILISCAFFFSLSLLFGLVSSELGGFQAFLGSGAVLSFLLIMTSVTFSSSHFISHTPFDWIILFYPGILLSYLAESSYFPTDTVGLDYENFYHLAWYGQHFWRSSTIGMGLIVGNYGLWTYWINQALNRRFRNPNATWLSKLNSYWLSGSFIIIVSGFVFQSGRYGNLGRHFFENFAILQVFIIPFACLLMVALSPQRQTLHDWARYRHQTAYNRRSRLVDLIVGDKSPSPLAIALNLAIIFAYLLPTILIAPLNKPFALLLCLFFSINMLIICAVIGQRILLFKLPKPSLVATFAIAVIIVVLPIFLGIFDILPHRVFTPWLFTVFSVLSDAGQPFTLFSVLFTLISQWGLIALTSVEMGKRLNKVGESDSKALLNT